MLYGFDSICRSQLRGILYNSTSYFIFNSIFSTINWKLNMKLLILKTLSLVSNKNFSKILPAYLDYRIKKFMQLKRR